MWGLRGAPLAVLQFHWRARRVAWRAGDLFSLQSATRPEDLRLILSLARGRRRVVELGTATAWTAISLVVDDPARHVVTYDIADLSRQIGPEHYLPLVGARARERISLVVAPGSAGPQDGQPVDLLYIDSSHEREQTIEEVHAWRDHLSPGALVLFDDYTNADYPGVREAVQELGLAGEVRGKLFIYRQGAGD
jgi:predicted O-methyltransferase YrrM